MVTDSKLACQLFDLVQTGATPEVPPKKVLLSTPGLQVVQLQIVAAQRIPPHSAPGEITVQPLRGRVSFHVGGQSHDLLPGSLLYVAPGELHSIEAIEDSCLLVTKRLP